MINYNQSICPLCKCELKYYDSVKRLVRTKGRQTSFIILHRFKCSGCGKLHRELPDYIFPYKQYEAEIINGVIDGLINCETLGYEDYPCEITMRRWRTQKLHGSL